MKLHLYKIREGYLVESESYTLLAEANGMWGFTENSDLAHVFTTEADAMEMASRWDPQVTR